MFNSDAGQPPPEMVNCLLVAGPFAGAKMRVPKGKKMLGITVQQDVVLDGVAYKKGAPAVYALETCVVTSPTMNDVTAFVIGMPPGTKLTDAFMQIIAGYCLLAQSAGWGQDDD